MAGPHKSFTAKLRLPAIRATLSSFLQPQTTLDPAILSHIPRFPPFCNPPPHLSRARFSTFFLCSLDQGVVPHSWKRQRTILSTIANPTAASNPRLYAVGIGGEHEYSTTISGCSSIKKTGYDWKKVYRWNNHWFMSSLSLGRSFCYSYEYDRTSSRLFRIATLRHCPRRFPSWLHNFLLEIHDTLDRR